MPKPHAFNANREIPFKTFLNLQQQSKNSQLSQNSIPIAKLPKNQNAGNAETCSSSRSFESLLSQLCTPESSVSNSQISYKSAIIGKKRKIDVNTKKPNFDESKSFELLLSKICTPPNTKDACVQTDFVETTISLGQLSQLSCNCHSSQFLRSIPRKDYAESVSHATGGVYSARLPAGPAQLLNWQFDVSAEHWLGRSLSYSLAFDKRAPRVAIFVNFADFEAESNPESVTRYRRTNLAVFRIEQVRTRRVRRDFNISSFCNVLTQNRSEEDLYTHRTATPFSIPDSYSLVEDSDDCDSSSTTSSQARSPADRQLELGLSKVARNKSLRFKNNPNEVFTSKADIQAMIDQLLNKVVQSLKDQHVPFFNIRSLSNEANCGMEEGRIVMKPIGETVKKRVLISNTHSRTKFLIMVYLLKKIDNLLDGNTKVTKRELYYLIKHLVKTQRQVDDAIMEVSCLLNVGPWQLNILANHGLVYGNLNILLTSKETINCNVPGTLIPIDPESILELQSNASFILIVEKESIFHKLLEENLPNKLPRPFIMITGKGHPDYNTKLFVNKLSKIMKLPVFILVDADVHGIKIMMEYRFGSVRSSHLSNAITVPNAKWLGVFPSEIKSLSMKTNDLSKTDKKLLDSLIQSKWLKDHPRIIQELKVLKDTNKKASIEGLIKNNTFLSQFYLPTKFFNQSFV